MCGINGILRLDPAAAPVDVDEALRTRERMRTRGPDGAGLWSDPQGDVVLGHRRLSIIDLSDAGLQPMASADGRYQIVFNGEIYNYRDLRAELQAHYPFRSHTDTEVILALYARDGVPGLARLRGMFAFGIWDTHDKRLLLARDPNGIKPLYYANDGKHFRFASQVKALVAGGAVLTREDPAGLCGFLLWGAVPEPWTIYEAVKAVPAGHVLQVDRDGLTPPQRLPHAERSPDQPTNLRTAIEDSVRAHLVSDVPVAVFLSSGLDSSVMAALAASALAEPLVTITLRFREFAGTTQDEGPLAAEIARAVGAKHVERWVSRDEFLAGWADALGAMDQPSIDGLNTYWVCRLAHEAGVKVALSGLGGDELLGGYPSFRQVPRLARWTRSAREVPGFTASWPRITRLSNRKRPKLSGVARHGGTLAGAYFLRRAVYLPEELAAIVGAERAEAGLSQVDPVAYANAALGPVGGSSDWSAVRDLETRVYLRNQLLRDSDWASMASSVELRVPFVDSRLQETTNRTGIGPFEGGKAAVIRPLAAGLPPTLFSRRKTGFLTPFPGWIAGSQVASTGIDSRRFALRILGEWGLPYTEARRIAPRAARTRRIPASETLVLAPGLFRETGGIQAYCRNLVEALRRLDAHPRVLVLNDSQADLAPLDGLPARGFARRRAAFAAEAVRIARRHRPRDIWLPHRNLVPLAPLLYRHGARLHLILHGIDAWPRVSRLECVALRYLDRVYAVSPYTAECFRRAGFRGEIGLLPCSLPHSWTPPEPVPSPWREPYRILSVSRLALPDRYKGIDHTIAAVAIARRGGLPLAYDVAGEGPDLDRLRCLARDHGVANAVHFHGRVTDDQLKALYRNCDLFVLPSGAEGFGIVYLEALAYERPVIAADAGGVPFFIRHGDTGWLVPYGNPDDLARCVQERLADKEGSLLSAHRGHEMADQQYSFSAFTGAVGASMALTEAVSSAGTTH
jgi:asparagine synthase (glutamine-hydrolysing)